LVSRAAIEYPDRIAVCDEQQTVTYSALERRVTGVATGLRGLGIGPRDRVAVLSRNRLEVVETYLALGMLGAAAVPLHWTAVTAEVADVLNRCDAAGLVGEHDLLTRAGPLPVPAVAYEGADYPGWAESGTPCPAGAVSDDELLFILHTSATTGPAKGVMVHHGSVAAATEA
jgi:acyl-CoA synthetase (AMP-forming)/AMP-acid ligase II